MKKHNWESIIKMNMQKLNRSVHYDELLEIIEPDLKKYNVGQNNKHKSEKVRQMLYERTYPGYGKDLWYEASFGKGKGYYHFLNQKDKIKLTINKSEIEQKILDEVPDYVDYSINPKKLQETIKKHEHIIQVIESYAAEQGIKLYKGGTKADFFIENSEEETTLVEVKTTHTKNINKQLRLGMAQVLQYKFDYKRLKGNSEKKINTYILYSEAKINDNINKFLLQYVDGVIQYKNKNKIVKELFKK